MIYDYYKLSQILATNDTTFYKDGLNSDIYKKECREIMEKDVAIIKIRLESNKYIKSIKDRRLTFPDKLASFGKQKYHYVLVSFC